MSAATMISCAADIIVMGRQSAIGPTDPQLSINNSMPVPVQAILDDYQKALNDLKVNLASAALWGPKLNALPNGFITYCQDTIERSKKLVEKWLKEYMKLSEIDASTISTWLSKEKHLSHGRPIGHEEASLKGLKIDLLENKQDVQDVILSIFHSVVLTFQKTNVTKLVENQNAVGVQVEARSGPAPNQPLTQQPAPEKNSKEKVVKNEEAQK